jgi:hypothetical protein
VQSLARWRLAVDRQRLLGPRLTSRTIVDITVIDLVGRTAVASV